MKDLNYDFFFRYYSFFNMFDKVRFYKVIWLNNDELLNVKFEDMFLILVDVVKNKYIVVVGNVRLLCIISYGCVIDFKDIVIRINRVFMFFEFSYGMKIDWLVFVMIIEKRYFESLLIKKLIWMLYK